MTAATALPGPAPIVAPPEEIRRGSWWDACAAAGGTVAAAVLLTAGGPVLLAGVGGLLVALVSAVRRPHLIAPVIVGGFTLQPAVKFFVTPLAGPAKDGVVVLALTVVGLCLLRGRRSSHLPDRTLLALLGVFVLTLAINPAGSHGPGWQFVTRLTIESFGLLLVPLLIGNPQRGWSWAAWSAVIVGLFESALGVAQQFIGVTRLVTQVGYAYGDQVRQTSGGQLRSFGTLDDPFNYATLTLLSLVCALQVVRRPAARLLVTSALALGVVVSFDRTAFVLLALVLALHLDTKGRRATALLMVAAVLLAGLALLLVKPQATAPTTVPADGAPASSSFLLSLNGRTATWLRVLRGPQDVLFGRGAGEIGAGLDRSQGKAVAVQGRYQAGATAAATSGLALTSLDSSYVEVLADVGLVGLVVLLATGARILGLLRASARGPGTPGAGGLAIFAVVALDGLTRTSLTAFPFGFVALYLLGAALAAARPTAPSPP